MVFLGPPKGEFRKGNAKVGPSQGFFSWHGSFPDDLLGIGF